ncbi:response regulator [Ideonella dechloratans]|uniref:Response regulator n=1 Tax=Ideonella dechloratans TaxID=36863 RepID=A0A643FH43_IDEDE|nr:response regulator [Ideonella dechloratans]
MNEPRVLLVEDDAAIRQFVTLALEDLPVALHACATVDQALSVLREGPVSLVLTDLHLVGDSGLRLLERLAADPALRGSARLAVFSGEGGGSHAGGLGGAGGVAAGAQAGVGEGPDRLCRGRAGRRGAAAGAVTGVHPGLATGGGRGHRQPFRRRSGALSSLPRGGAGPVSGRPCGGHAGLPRRRCSRPAPPGPQPAHGAGSAG